MADVVPFPSPIVRADLEKIFAKLAPYRDDYRTLLSIASANVDAALNPIPAPMCRATAELTVNQITMAFLALAQILGVPHDAADALP